ncbi:MAG: GNAT family N-acetyltransferase, partial [Candidatus Promineofilum sp.]|nr:GNAT family N-acetyltransferase [Promineifilum sp.]
MATSQLEITPHLASPEQLAQAAAVYYEGFAHKLDGLEFISRPPAQAIRILIASIQPEMATYALLDGRVVGVAGMQYRGRRFYVVPWRVWRAEFGVVGGLRRWLWFRLGQQFVHPAADALRVDGIAVSAAARGLGVGTQLMAALDAHARAAGLRAVELEVVDTNPDARRLYERLGFVVLKEQHYGRLTAGGGFTGATYMRKEL